MYILNDFSNNRSPKTSIIIHNKRSITISRLEKAKVLVKVICVLLVTCSLFQNLFRIFVFSILLAILNSHNSFFSIKKKLYICWDFFTSITIY